MTVVSLQANIDQSYYRMLATNGELALAENIMAKRPSVEERVAAGKALREKVPRSKRERHHGEQQRREERSRQVLLL